MEIFLVLFEAIFEILFMGSWIFPDSKTDDTPQLEGSGPRKNLTSLENAVISAGLNYTKATISSGRHVVRCTLGPQQLTFSFGTVKKDFFSTETDEYTLECVVPLNARTHSFPLFSINSDLDGGCSLINKGSVDELIFTPHERIAYGLSLDFNFHGAVDTDLLTLLTPEISIKLRQLKGLFGGNGLVVLSENQELRFSKKTWDTAGLPEFSLFITVVLELVSAFFECVGPSLQPRQSEEFTVTPSISSAASNYNDSPLEYLSAEGSIKLLHCSTFSEEDKHCQICGDLIGTEYVICTACHIPHHKDCWHYNGRCSTFGCMCTTFKSH